ncbi:MAG: hypothetical protein ABJA34_10365 [Pseudonocardiales bacterium]
MSLAAAADDRAPTAVERVSGAVLVTVATLLAVLLEGFLAELRVGTTHLPVSIAMAVLLHPLLTVLMGEVTRTKAAMFLPFLVWIVVVWPLGSQRAEGDLIIVGSNWSLALLGAGALAFAGTLGLRLPVAPHVRGSLGGNGSG